MGFLGQFLGWNTPSNQTFSFWIFKKNNINNKAILESYNLLKILIFQLSGTVKLFMNRPFVLLYTNIMSPHKMQYKYVLVKIQSGLK